MARNVEIKLRVADLAPYVHRLQGLSGVRDGGVHEQRDVFFHCRRGRLKLRVVTGAPAQLIHYDRTDTAALRASQYTLVETVDGDSLCAVLDAVLGRRGEVRKRRQLFLWDNIRIHLDTVAGLGNFVEIEAVVDPAHDEAACHEGARRVRHALGLADATAESRAYIDLLETP
jgi:predicted adenylyl cyclase CyaB